MISNKIHSYFLRIKKGLAIFGPGVVTGASDDDPSGIATYSQAGAMLGLSTLWTALITFPLMASIQEICARIGLVTSVGLTTTLKNHYPKWVLYLMMFLSIPAIILNISADIAGMGAVAHLIFPFIGTPIYTVIFTLILIGVIIYLPYHKIVAILKYLCLTLLLYLIVPFIIHTDWTNVMRATFVPNIKLNKGSIEILVAIFGTTISPYLFFWQVTMEAKDVESSKSLILARHKINANKKIETDNRAQKLIVLLIKKMMLDVNIGMFLSNLVMFFIILTTGTVLFNAGIHQINTIEQAALALKPVAGKATYLLFALGVIGTGLLAIPVLCGSLSYIVSETFGWKGDLDRPFHKAKAFYGVITCSLITGLVLNYIGISAIQALVYTAILYGVTSPFLIAMVLLIANNKTIMGIHTNGWLANILGGITFLLMTISSLALVYFEIF